MNQFFTYLKEVYFTPFWLGYAAALSCVAFVQDFMGKEKYLEVASENWINTHWSWWLVLMIAFMYNGLKNTSKGN